MLITELKDLDFINIITKYLFKRIFIFIINNINYKNYKN